MGPKGKFQCRKIPNPQQNKKNFNLLFQLLKPAELKMELGTGAMAGLAREAHSYRHLSAVPTRQTPPESGPEPRRRARNRPAAIPTSSEKEPKSPPGPSPTTPSSDKSKSPPPVAPRPKARGAQPSPKSPQSASASSEATVTSSKVRIAGLCRCAFNQASAPRLITSSLM